MNAVSKRLNLKSWASEDRPREKLLAKGQEALSDAELIAILIGAGNRRETAVDLSKRLLNAAGNNLNELGKYSVEDLQRFKGIGEAKAVSVMAALELGRRRKASEAVKKTKINSSRDVYSLMGNQLADLPYEELWVLLINRANRVIDKKRVSSGGVNETVADIRIIYKPAIERLASAIILCHNHPSAQAIPSQSDMELTKRIKLAGVTLDIPLLDHVIVADREYYSFADEGTL